jgi:hypothetical protein
MARLQARLNVARLAATYLGDYSPTVTIHINSTQAYRPGGVQGIVVDPSLSIDEADMDVPRTARFEIRDASSPPQQGQRVYIGLGSADHRIFGGHIIKASQEQSRYVEMPVFTVECQDNQRLMNRRLVTARFTTTQAGDIVKALINSYTSGFTAVHVEGEMGQVDEIEFTRESVNKAITRTMNRVGGRWYLDPYDDVHAFVGEETGVSPAAPITTSATVSKHWGWKHDRDTSQVRTKVIVVGGGHPTSEQASLGATLIFLDDTEYLTAVSTISAGRYIYDVASVNRVADPWFVVLSNSIGNGGLQEGLPAGTPFNVYAVAQSTTLQNSIAAIEGGDGIHEYAVSDGRLTQAGALQRAQAELTIFGSIEHKGSYTTRDPSAQAGRVIGINAGSPTHISSVSAKIQRVSVSQFEESSRSWNTNRYHLFPQRKVTYSSAAVRDVYQILGDFERAE